MAKVLFIDTDEQYARFLCGHLKNAGFTCIYKKTGEDILEFIDKHGADVVVCEAMLPDVCGFGISRRIRSHENHFMIPVILLSTMSEEAELRYGYTQGVDAYLTKPVEPHVLVSCVTQKIAEAASSATDDPLTGLYSSGRIKSSVQRAITKRQQFVLTYIEMLAVPNFSRMHGMEARDRAIRHLAKMLNHWGDKYGNNLFEASHMGMGHFVCIVEPDRASSFCDALNEEWERHLPKLNPAVKIREADEAAAPPRALPDLSLIICATGSGVAGAHSAQEYFDTLAQLHKKALASGKGGVFVDNRHKF